MSETVRIMVVEDSEADFMLIKRALRTLEQPTCFTRLDTAEALDEALRQHDWAAALCDYNIPGMRFQTTLQTIIARQPNLPLILVSGDIGVEQAADLLKQGVWDFVLKDNLARLPSALARALREAADHSARMQAEAALRLGEERLRLAIEGASLGTWHLEISEGRYAAASMSEFCSAILGLESGILIDRHTFFRIIHPDDRDAVEEALRHAIAGGTDFDAEYRIVLDDGSERWVAARAGVQRDKAGTVVSMEGVAQDISVRKKAELVLMQARDIAEAANRAKNEFLAVISHELRTPLNGILGGVQLLQTTDLDPDQEEFLSLIDISANNEFALVSELLDLVQIEADGLPVISKEFALRRFVEDTLKIQALQARDKGLALTTTVAAELPDTLSGDPLRLRQILLNLLGNAIKFTEQGRIELNVEMAGHDAQGAIRARFSVCDTGIGMLAEDLERIFTPFVQVDMKFTRRYGGAGLGLAVCRRLTEMLGGRIWAESVPGKGSSFHLELPFNLCVGAQSALRPQATAGSQHFSILLVDDDYYCLKVGSALLEKLGHQVTTATNGREALEEFQRAPFDLILMDVQMPIMNGIEALIAIRDIELARGLRHTPVIAQTAYALSGDHTRLLATGFDGYLTKPLLMAQLTMEIDRATTAPA